MARYQNDQNRYGEVLVCGASAIALNHREGEPTSIDNMVSAFKRLVGSVHFQADAPVNCSSSTARGIAG